MSFVGIEKVILDLSDDGAGDGIDEEDGGKGVRLPALINNDNQGRSINRRVHRTEKILETEENSASGK